jgi:hypothetical protein
VTSTRLHPISLCSLCLALALCGCGQTGTATTPTEQTATAPIDAPAVAEQAVSSDPGSRTLPFTDPIGGITVETDPLRGVPVAATQPTYVDPLEAGGTTPLPAPAIPPQPMPEGPVAAPDTVTTAPPSRGLPLTGSGALPPPVDPSGR